MKTKTSEEKEHSEFGGSQAERIINCPGSVILSRGIPNKSNAASEEGTEAHACLEFIINNRKKLNDKLTRKKVLDHAEQKWNQDQIDYALDALTWINEQISPNGEIFVEQKIDSSKYTTEGQKSTVDISIANWSARELIVADYKYGKHAVEVKKNSQIIYYALGVIFKLNGWKKFDRIRCVIIQPRAHHKDGQIREWYISIDSAINWGRKFKKAVKIALKPNAPLKYGEKYCFFCLAKNKCPVMKTKNAAKDFDVIDDFNDEKGGDCMPDKTVKKASKKKASKKVSKKKVSKKVSKK